MKLLTPLFGDHGLVFTAYGAGATRILAGQLRDLVGSYVAVLAIASIMMSFFLIPAPRQESRKPSS